MIYTQAAVLAVSSLLLNSAFAVPVKGKFAFDTHNTAAPVVLSKGSSNPQDEGVDGPFPVTTNGVHECVAEWNRVQSEWETEGLIAKPYPKSAHIFVEGCRKIAMQPALLDAARRLIGEDDIMVATMSVLVKPPQWEHRWHTDVENTIDNLRCKDKSWTAWVPVENTGPDSTLYMVTHTHQANEFAHTVLAKQCKTCDPADKPKMPSLVERGRQLEATAHARGWSDATFVQLAAMDNNAWLFRGATWHSSINKSDKTRLALQMHYMPSYCAFREDEKHMTEPPVITETGPRPPGIEAVIPAVIPVLGKASPTVSSTGTGWFRNNWMLPDEPEPAVVDATFDRTPVRVEYALKYDMQHPETLHGKFSKLMHNLNESSWADTMCTVKAGVDASKGIVDATKCKAKQTNGHTDLLRVMEYHTSKLLQNNAAHEMRTHEELELVYMLKGTLRISLRQEGKHPKVVYRRMLDEGDLAYYPGWQPHGLVSVEHPQAVYLAIRYIGHASVKPAPNGRPLSSLERPFFWLGVNKETLETKEFKDSGSVITRVTDGAQPLLSSSSFVDFTDPTSDQLIIVTRGTIESGDGKQWEGPATIFIPTGLKTSLRSVSPTTIPRVVRIIISPLPGASTASRRLALPGANAKVDAAKIENKEARRAIKKLARTNVRK